MAQELLTERHPEQIAGVISCWDRVVIRGMLTTLGCPDGMTAYLSARGCPPLQALGVGACCSLLEVE